MRALAALVVALVAPVAGAGDSPPARPDLLLVTVDTLRADHLSLYGYGRPTSPRLDARAASGVVFERAYSTSSWTVPAMASLVTGLSPFTHRVVHGLIVGGRVYRQEVLPDGLPLLAEELQRQGYRTFAVTANTHLTEPYGFARGFDRFEGLPFGEPADRVNQALLAWRAELDDRSRPAFVWLHYCDPHFGYRRNEPWFGRFVPDATAEELAALDRARATWPRLPPEILAAPQRFRTLAVALYDSEIAFWDEAFDRLLAEVPRLARATTLVTADHGEQLGDHGRFSHGTDLYDETLRVPLVAWGPGIPAGRRERALVGLLDVPVTLLGLAGLTPPPSWQGLPLPLAAAAAGGADRALLAGLERDGERGRARVFQALVEDRYKLVLQPGSGATELYDLVADPGERADLAATLPAERDRLLARLLAALAATTRVAEPRLEAVPAAEVEQLRALGYVEPAPPAAGAQAP